MMGEGKCFMHMVLVVRHLFQEDHKIPEAAVGTFLRDSIQPFSMDQQFQTKQHIFFVYENDHSHGFREGWRIKGLAKMDQEMILDSYLQMFPRVSRCRMGTLSSMSYDDAILMPFNRIQFRKSVKSVRQQGTVKRGLRTCSAWYKLYVDATRKNLSFDKVTAPCRYRI